MKLADVYYHGIRQQIRRVLVALGPERTEKGLTAFADGASNWSDCFFARAFEDEINLNKGNPERKIMEALNIDSVIPVRIVWNLFDQIDSWHAGRAKLSRDDFRKFIESVLDESRPQEVVDLLRSLNVDDTTLHQEVSCQ